MGLRLAVDTQTGYTAQIQELRYTDTNPSLASWEAAAEWEGEVLLFCGSNPA